MICPRGRQHHVAVYACVTRSTRKMHFNSPCEKYTHTRYYPFSIATYFHRRQFERWMLLCVCVCGQTEFRCTASLRRFHYARFCFRKREQWSSGDHRRRNLFAVMHCKQTHTICSWTRLPCRANSTNWNHHDAIGERMCMCECVLLDTKTPYTTVDSRTISQTAHPNASNIRCNFKFSSHQFIMIRADIWMLFSRQRQFSCVNFCVR